MACSSCGRKYPRSSRNRNNSMQSAKKQNVTVAPQPVGGVATPEPAAPEIITAGQVVKTDLGNTNNNTPVEIVPYPTTPSN